jgi:DNA-binding beta-propeller fold protein YncE
MPMLRALRFAIVAFALSIVACFIAPVSFAAAQQPYQVIAHWKIGGAGRWDYMHVDPKVHRLYIAHGDTVDVIDTRTGKSAGSITGLHGTHGIALDNEGKYGYISDGGGDAVVVFDRKSFKKIATVPAGINPDGIVFEPITHSVWAFNGGSRNATVISAYTHMQIATISLPGRPEFPVVDGDGNVYDNIESTSQIVRLDAQKKQVTALWSVGCDSPSGLAVDRHGHRLFSVCRNHKMSVIDYKDGKVLASPSIGAGPDAARWSEKFKIAFASCGEGVLSVINAGEPGYPTVETLPTQRGARTMAYDPSTDRIYLATADFGPAPAATKEHPHPRPEAIPGSFTILVVGRQ